MVLVDGMLVVGEQLGYIMTVVNAEFLLQGTRQLRGGQRLSCMVALAGGAVITYVLGCTTDYGDEVLCAIRMHNCKGSATPGTSSVQHPGGRRYSKRRTPRATETLWGSSCGSCHYTQT